MSKAYREPAPMPPPPPEPYDESAVAFMRGAARRQALVNASLPVYDIVVVVLVVLLLVLAVRAARDPDGSRLHEQPAHVGK